MSTRIVASLVPSSTVAASAVDSNQWILLGVGVFVLLGLLVWQRNQRLRQSGDNSDSRHREWNKTQREITEIMSHLEQLSLQIHQKIDQRLARLDALVRQADERIDQLNRLERSRQGITPLDIELASETPQSSEAADENPHQPIYRLADAGYTPIQIAKKLSRHTGEVELILSLRRARRASA